MVDFDQFERRLAVALRSDADVSVAPFDPASIARAAIQIDHTRQGSALRLPRRIATMNMPTRFAAAAVIAAVIAVLAVGGAIYLLRPSQPSVGTPSSTPNASSSPTESVVPSPSAAARAPSWTATGSMGTPRRGQSATLLEDGRVLVVGGEPNGPKPPSAELYDPTTGSWTDAGRTLGYSGTHLTRLLDGRVLAGTSDLYDPGTGSWTATGRTVAVHQDGETTTLLLDGRVLVAGGHDDRYPPKGVTASAELYDPASGTWTATGSMVTPRAGHTATLLPDGKVLVAGGGDWEDATAATELYDPASGSWTATGTMLMAYPDRYANSNQVATLLLDGRVLVTGSALAASSATPPPFCPSGPCSFVSIAELYDPTSGTWTATRTMAAARELFTVTLLPDGKVLAAGGIGLVSGSYDDVDLASAELYDPSTGSWTAAARMTVARDGHTGTVLPNGKVLVAGGGSNMLATDQASAELYDPGNP